MILVSLLISHCNYYTLLCLPALATACVNMFCHFMWIKFCDCYFINCWLSNDMRDAQLRWVCIDLKNLGNFWLGKTASGAVKLLRRYFCQPIRELANIFRKVLLSSLVWINDSLILSTSSAVMSPVRKPSRAALRESGQRCKPFFKYVLNEEENESHTCLNVSIYIV